MPSPARSPRIAIIGSGFGGLCMAIQLKRAGIDSLHDPREGGAPRRDLARQHLPRRGLRLAVVPLLLLLRAEDRLVAEVGAAARDPRLHRALRAEVRPPPPHPLRHRGRRRALRRGRGRLARSAPTAGETIEAEVLVSGVGQLNRPVVSRRSPGSSASAGTTFHSARWKHDYDLRGQARRGDRQRRERDPVRPADRARGRRGSPSSSAAPTGCSPKNDRAYSAREKRLFRALPAPRAALSLVDLAQPTRCASPSSGRTRS